MSFSISVDGDRRMPDTCNSRSLNWLVNSCIPKSSDDLQTLIQPQTLTLALASPISSLSDDLLLSCLARLPLCSLPSAAAACRRFHLLLSSPFLFPLRRSLLPLLPVLFSFSGDLIAVLPLSSSATNWRLLPNPNPSSSVVSLRNSIFILSAGSPSKLDAWTSALSPISPPSIPRKKFAAAVLNDQIYVAGGTSRSSAVEIYDPTSNTWRIATDAPVRRYGCFGAAAGDVFYIAGGLRVGDGDARAAGTVDSYHVRAGAWSRGSRAVPGGGCIVGACGVGPSLYVVASNAVEFTFWRRVRGGEWAPLEAPPVQVGKMAAVRFSCCAIGSGKMAAMVHVGGGGDSGGVVLLYDVLSGEWSRGPELPAGFRRGGLVCVEC